MKARRHLTVGMLRQFTATMPDSTRLVACPSTVNPDEPAATQEFIEDDEHKIVAMDDGGRRGVLRLGFVE